jgi:hypothetical protein
MAGITLFNADPNVALPAYFVNAVQGVANFYNQTFTQLQNITVNIGISFGEYVSSSNNTGHPQFSQFQASPGNFTAGFTFQKWATNNYTTAVNALRQSSQQSATQKEADATIPQNSPFGGVLIMTNAQEKALGLPANNTLDGFDAYCGFISDAELAQAGDTANWDVNTTTLQSNQLDMVGEIEHEFSEALGRVGWVETDPVGSGPSYSLMDLFRYSPSGQFQTNPSGTAYFSIDGGRQLLKQWNDKSIHNTGDLGDWAGSSPDAYDDIAPLGKANRLSTTDYWLMNAIGWNEVNPPAPPPEPPPAGTTADMILRHGADGLYEIYDIGSNAILAAYQLGQVGTDWKFAGLGNFFGNDTTDMLLRSATSGTFEVYDISNNNITNAASLGAVGSNWQVMGFGNFSSLGETDMIMRNANNGGVEVYDIRNNQIIGASFMGAVGLNWQFSGVGNFSGRGTSDMMLRDSNTGGLEVYDINNNQITGAAFIGAVGTNWQFSGVGNFSGVPGETDLLLRNANTGGLEVYDINNNQLTGAAFIGNVGVDWQYAGVAPVSGAGRSDLVLRNVNSGAFEVYNIANNQLIGAAALGAVGTDWQLGGFAVDPPTAPAGSMGNTSDSAQLVQAMAGFGGSSGAAEGLSTAALSATDTSQQQLLTTPQHV